MKKVAALFMAAAMLILTGCGDDEKVIDGNGQNPEGNGSRTEGSGTAENDKAAGGKGYVFTCKGTSVQVDADAAPVVSALGEPVSYYEAASCAFEGLDKFYTYNGFELHTYPSEDKDYVSAIVFIDDSVSTAEGVSIGDTLEKVKEAYGEGTEESGMLVYEKDGMKLCFILKDTVVSIEYRSTVLDQ